MSRSEEVALTGTRRRVNDKALVGSQCPSCGATSWPSRAVCHRCGTGMTLEVPLASTGILVSYTRVWVARPGLPTPYLLGQIQIADTTFFAQIRHLPAGAQVPLPVRLALPDAADTVDFWFEPEAAEAPAPA